MSSAGLAAWTESLVSKCELSGKYQIVAAITARWRQRISTCQPSESVTWGNYWGRVRCDPIKSADNMEFGRLLGNIWMALHLIMIMMNRLYGWWECQEALGHPPVVTGVRSDHRHPVFIRTQTEFLYSPPDWREERWAVFLPPLEIIRRHQSVNTRPGRYRWHISPSFPALVWCLMVR